jgi:hypothetical protein
VIDRCSRDDATAVNTRGTLRQDRVMRPFVNSALAQDNYPPNGACYTRQHSRCLSSLRVVAERGSSHPADKLICARFVDVSASARRIP